MLNDLRETLAQGMREAYRRREAERAAAMQALRSLPSSETMNRLWVDDNYPALPNPDVPPKVYCVVLRGHAWHYRREYGVVWDVAAGAGRALRMFPDQDATECRGYGGSSTITKNEPWTAAELQSITDLVKRYEEDHA